MSSVASSSPSVNDISMAELQRLTNRAIGLYRAAQVLADATLCRAGQRPESLKSMDPVEAVWFKQTAAQLIEIFEEITGVSAPPIDKIQRLSAHPREEAINQERQRARLAALARGHELATFAPLVAGDIHDEGAACVRCLRSVRIVVIDGPPLQITHEGAAIEEGCLVVAAPLEVE